MPTSIWTRFLSAALSASGLTLAAATPAYAITFATGQGTDSASCGAVTTPCRTLQQAVTNAPAGGYVVLKGPADFGPVEISKAITVVGEDGASVHGNATDRLPLVIIGGSSDVIRLRGLTVLGNKAAIEGVTLVSGARMEIANCVFRDFTGTGVNLTRPASVIDTASLGNGQAISAGSNTGPSIGYFNGLRLEANAGVPPYFFSGFFAGGSVARMVVLNSVATGHTGGAGFTDTIGSGDVIIRDTVSSGNQSGVSSLNGVTAIQRVTLTSNNQAVSSTGVRSYGGNVVRGNTDDTLGRIFPQPLR